MVTVCPSQFATRRTLFHVLVGCGLLMLKVSRLKLPVRSEERFSRNAATDLVCRLLLEKKKHLFNVVASHVSIQYIVLHPTKLLAPLSCTIVVAVINLHQS